MPSAINTSLDNIPIPPAPIEIISIIESLIGAINLGGSEIDYDKLAASMSRVQIVTDVTDVVNKTNSKMAMSHLANKRYSS